LKIYTIHQVAEILQMPVETIYKHLRAGKLKGAKLGKHWRISDEKLKEYLDEHTL